MFRSTKLEKMMERKSEEIVVEEMKCFQKCDNVCTYIHTDTHSHVQYFHQNESTIKCYWLSHFEIL